MRRKFLYFQETALVVNSRRAERQKLEHYFSAADYYVLTARTMDQALELCRSYEGAIHTMIADPRTSGADAWKFAESAMQIRPGLVVLFISLETLGKGELIPSVGSAYEPSLTPQMLASVTHALMKRELRHCN